MIIYNFHNLNKKQQIPIKLNYLTNGKPKLLYKKKLLPNNIILNVIINNHPIIRHKLYNNNQINIPFSFFNLF